MGFDLSGINAKNETGEYFRNNIWWWRRLWDLCCQCPKFNDKDKEKGGFNNGKSIKGKKHEALVEFIGGALKNKRLFKPWIEESEKAYTHFETEGQGKMVCTHPFDWKNVESFYEFIKNNEGFCIC